MEFGAVTQAELNKINFRLPKEPAFNKQVLSGKKLKHPKIFVGCAKWGRKDWVGKIYPKGTSEKDFLAQYIARFNCIELNATGYKMPSITQVKKWKNLASGKKFLFCPKLTRYIVPGADHEKEKKYTSQFLEAVSAFDTHLGPLYLVLKDFSPAKEKYLYEYLTAFPKGYNLFLELRHAEWFSEKEIYSRLIKELSISNVGLVITDTAGRRDVATMQLTVPKVFIRFVGNSLHPSDFIRCDDWVLRIKNWLDSGLKELYFFMHMHEEAHSPELIQYFIKKLNSKCGLSIAVPTLEMQ